MLGLALALMVGVATVIWLVCTINADFIRPRKQAFDLIKQLDRQVCEFAEGSQHHRSLGMAHANTMRHREFVHYLSKGQRLFVHFWATDVVRSNQIELDLAKASAARSRLLATASSRRHCERRSSDDVS